MWVREMMEEVEIRTGRERIAMHGKAQRKHSVLTFPPHHQGIPLGARRAESKILEVSQASRSARTRRRELEESDVVWVRPFTARCGKRQLVRVRKPQKPAFNVAHRSYELLFISSGASRSRRQLPRLPSCPLGTQAAWPRLFSLSGLLAEPR